MSKKTRIIMYSILIILVILAIAATIYKNNKAISNTANSSATGSSQVGTLNTVSR